MAKTSTMGSDSHPLQRRLLAQLQLARSAHGHGNASLLDARLGKSEGYIGRVLRGEIGLQTGQLFKLLNVLEVEPAAFFATVVGADFSPRQFLKQWARTLVGSPTQPALPISDEVLKSLKNLLQPRSDSRTPDLQAASLHLKPFRTRHDRKLCQAAQKIADAAGFTDGDDLEPAAELLSTTHEGYAEGRVSGTTLARVLRLAASLEQDHGHTATAVHFLRIAFDVVDHPSSAGIALLLEAVKPLLAKGQIVAADLFVDEAQRQAITLGARHSMGTTLLARGRIALAQNLAKEARVAFEASIQYLQPEDWESHLQAHHGAARCHLAQGDCFRAGRDLAKAVARHPTRRGRRWAALQRTRADWTLARAKTPEDLETAARLYDEALGALDPQRQPIDAVTLYLQQAGVWLHLGDALRVRHTAAAALQLTGRLKKAKPTQDLVMRLATLAMTGELTHAWLERAVQRVTPSEMLVSRPSKRPLHTQRANPTRREGTPTAAPPDSPNASPARPPATDPPISPHTP